MKEVTIGELWRLGFGDPGAFIIKVLKEHGVTDNHLVRFSDEPDYVERVAKFMLKEGISSSTRQNTALGPKDIAPDSSHKVDYADWGFDRY